MSEDLVCELSARITPGDAKCDLYYISRSPSCRVCLVRPGITLMTKGDEMGGSKRGDCVVCGKENITLPVTGKCSVCYARYRKETGKKGPVVVSTPAPVKRADVKNKAVSDAVVGESALEQGTEMRLCDGCGNDPCLCVEVCVDVPITFGTVVNGDGNRVPFGVDEVIWLALEDAFTAKKNEWLVELSGLQPAVAIFRTAEMLRAIEGMDY